MRIGSRLTPKLVAGEAGTNYLVAELADAPDLGLRNHRFQSVAFHFKANTLYEGKTGFSYEIVTVTNSE